MNNYLKIEILIDKTKIQYIDNGESVFAIESPIGYLYLEERSWDNFSGKKWFSYILWALHSISYIDRIPTRFIVDTVKNSYFFIMILQSYKYVEFFTFNKNIHVIIGEDKDFNNTKHARYKKTISNFKV